MTKTVVEISKEQINVYMKRLAVEELMPPELAAALSDTEVDALATITWRWVDTYADGPHPGGKHLNCIAVEVESERCWALALYPWFDIPSAQGGRPSVPEVMAFVETHAAEVRAVRKSYLSGERGGPEQSTRGAQAALRPQAPPPQPARPVPPTQAGMPSGPSEGASAPSDPTSDWEDSWVASLTDLWSNNPERAAWLVDLLALSSVRTPYTPHPEEVLGVQRDMGEHLDRVYQRLRRETPHNGYMLDVGSMSYLEIEEAVAQRGRRFARAEVSEAGDGGRASVSRGVAPTTSSPPAVEARGEKYSNPRLRRLAREHIAEDGGVTVNPLHFNPAQYAEEARRAQTQKAPVQVRPPAPNPNASYVTLPPAKLED